MACVIPAILIDEPVKRAAPEATDAPAAKRMKSPPVSQTEQTPPTTPPPPPCQSLTPPALKPSIITIPQRTAVDDLLDEVENMTERQRQELHRSISSMEPRGALAQGPGSRPAISSAPDPQSLPSVGSSDGGATQGPSEDASPFEATILPSIPWSLISPPCLPMAPDEDPLANYARPWDSDDDGVRDTPYDPGACVCSSASECVCAESKWWTRNACFPFPLPFDPSNVASFRSLGVRSKPPSPSANADWRERGCAFIH
uniref:Uncharacterized protein n=1 Tax=Hemiselmis andersenii TaxID=464988 RepID=A0A6U4SRW4_HEMAN|mmetsp:Transcript_15518/g.37627  ORF Transcript_15518/g.37627 Transcript_15518/m.37627 type:complete len:258 (+) Transcript_15518:107-880(+)